MTRTYGAIEMGPAGEFVITSAEPHVLIKLKAIFRQIKRTETPPYVFRPEPETGADLEWFLQRYPLKAAPATLRTLRDRRREFEQLQLDVEDIFGEAYRPPSSARMGINPETGQPYEVRHYQAQAVAMLKLCKGLLLGDEVGLGKTYVTAAAALEPGMLPAIVVCQGHLQSQWVEVIERFTSLTAHAVRVTTPYPLPPVDVRVFRYTQLAGWFDMLGAIGCGLVAFDEVQELRGGVETQKGQAAMRLARAASHRLGLTATPIYNYGEEVFTVMQFVAPGVLGSREEFMREWCGGTLQVKDPRALGSYLRERRSFLRRTKADVGQELPKVSRIVDMIDYDRQEMASVEDVAYELAAKASYGAPMERGDAARMLDMRVRHATGVAKAKAVAKIVRVLVEGGEPVVLCGWHKAVYAIWEQELADLRPVFFTGRESPVQKKASKDAFVAGKSDLFIMSLRSGAGLDGLQFRCSTMVFGELDWSPGIHHQCIGRLDREGQTSPVTALFLVADDGADPPMMEVLGLKAAQAALIVDPSLGVQAASNDESHLKKLIQRYLDKRGVNAPAAVARREAAE